MGLLYSSMVLVVARLYQDSPGCTRKKAEVAARCAGCPRTTVFVICVLFFKPPSSLETQCAWECGGFFCAYGKQNRGEYSFIADMGWGHTVV